MSTFGVINHQITRYVEGFMIRYFINHILEIIIINVV